MHLTLPRPTQFPQDPHLKVSPHLGSASEVPKAPWELPSVPDRPQGPAGFPGPPLNNLDRPQPPSHQTACPILSLLAQPWHEDWKHLAGCARLPPQSPEQPHCITGTPSPAHKQTSPDPGITRPSPGCVPPALPPPHKKNQ